MNIPKSFHFDEFGLNLGISLNFKKLNYNYGRKILSNTRDVLQEKLHLLQICAFNSQLEGCKRFYVICTRLFENRF
jgi:hypothetical protein